MSSNRKGKSRVTSGSAWATVWLVFACVGVQAQPAPEKTKDAPAAAKSQPTLDELLGIKKSAPADPAGEPKAGAPKTGAPEAGAGVAQGAEKDANAAQLDQLLTGKQLADAFEQATTLMNDAAKRLDGQSDAGLDTQRMQEDIIRKLEQVLDAIQQQSQQQSSSSSKPKPSDQQPEPENSAQKQSQGQQQQRQQGDGQAEAMPPNKVEGALPPGLEGARAAWGSLPGRVREMLMQGAGDRFSSKYQGLTEAYYRRLAEEKDKK